VENEPRGRGGALLALWAAAAFACTPCTAAASEHLYVPITPGAQSTGVIATYPLASATLGATPADFAYQNVGTYAFALGPDGLLYASDGSTKVSVYASRANQLLYSFHTPQVCLGSGQYNVTGIGVDAADYLYVGYAITGCGGFALKYGTRGAFVYAPGQHGGTPLLRIATVTPATDFAFDAAGDAYVSEIYYPGPIEVFASPHSQPARIRSLKDFRGRCMGPVALDGMGELYAVVGCTSAGGSSVAVYPQTAHGAPKPTRTIHVAGGLGCCSLALLGQALYSSNGSNTVYELDKDGRGIVRPVSWIQTPPQFYGYFGLRVGP
jgi:hypothetical protein